MTRNSHAATFGGPAGAHLPGEPEEGLLRQVLGGGVLTDERAREPGEGGHMLGVHVGDQRVGGLGHRPAIRHYELHPIDSPVPWCRSSADACTVALRRRRGHGDGAQNDGRDPA